MAERISKITKLCMVILWLLDLLFLSQGKLLYES